MKNINILKKNNNGIVKITNTALTTIIGKATTMNYGVVGMASQHELHDGISHILNRQNYSKGILLRKKDAHSPLEVNIYVVVPFGIKISEVAKLIQQNVKSKLNAMLGISNLKINVIIQGVRVLSNTKNHKQNN